MLRMSEKEDKLNIWEIFSTGLTWNYKLSFSKAFTHKIPGNQIKYRTRSKMWAKLKWPIYHVVSNVNQCKSTKICSQNKKKIYKGLAALL
jgi:hypothetical protein